MHTLNDDELLEEVVRLDGIPHQLRTSGEMRDLFLPILRADLQLDETYTYSPEPPLPCPILACGGKDDPEAPVAGVREWQFYTESRFALKIMQGGHFFMQTNAALFTSELLAFLGSVVPAII
jgi:medium-chain acyl-[acyl-carrier-protein] hydrolase